MHTVEHFRARLGRWIFGKLLLPPESPHPALLPPSTDYSHSYLYDSLFGNDPEQLDAATILTSEAPKPILDLCGGTGRLSLRLARRGFPVTLVDRSETMLQTARGKLQKLPKQFHHSLKILNQDIRKLSLERTHKTAVIFNHGLEHLDTAEEIRSTLSRIHSQIDHSLYFDAHHIPFWLPVWNRKRWQYVAHADIKEGRFRIWERVQYLPKTGRVVWEHAIGHWTHWSWLKTPLSCFSLESWKQLLAKTPFTLKEVWGGWEGSPVSDRSAKLVFWLKR